MNLSENSAVKSLTGFGRLGRLYRHMGRATEVASVMVKFGLGGLLLRLGLNDLLDQVRSLVGLKPQPQRLSRPQRVRLALEELGVVFVKWGQYLSTRADLLPETYLKEFARLQDSVQPLAFEEVERILAPIMEAGELRQLSVEPLASASVGQVHSAILGDGSEVVVKVQRPGLQKQVSTDLEILAELAELVEKHLPALASARPRAMVAEFSRALTAELDFSLEAQNLERFGRFYAANPRVKVPRVYRSLCGERIMVMEKLKGLSLNEPELLRAAGYDLKQLARFGADVVFEQIMVFGYFHGDPHPGNLFVQPGPRLVLLDFGLVGRLKRRTRELVFDLALAMSRRQPRAVTTALLKLLEYNGSAPPDRERLEVEVDLFLEARLGRPLKEIDIGRTLNDMLNIAAQYQLALPQDLMLLVKALTQVESLGRRLDPDFDLLAAARPFLLRQFQRRYDPRYWFKRFGEGLDNFKNFVEMLPADLKPLYNMLRAGRFKSEIEVEGLEQLRQTVDRASYRLSFALVLASLVIGSSLVVLSGVPPKWHDLPILGLLGFLGAALVGFWLIYDFLRNRRL